jgi:hypothetical protein
MEEEREKLLRKHATELAYLEARAKQQSGSPGGPGSKKKLGSAVAVSVSPQSPAALKAAAAVVEMQARHVKELEELEQRISQVCITNPATSEPSDLVKDNAYSSLAGDNQNDDSTDKNGEDSRDLLTQSEISTSTSPSLTRSGSKAQRRREQKAAEFAALRSESSNAGGSLSSVGPSMREIEIESLHKQLKPLGFGIKLIAADGHCMFRAISEQLRLKVQQSSSSTSFTSSSLSSSSSSIVIPDYLTLRTRASEYITMHWKTFAPFLPYESPDRYPEEGDEEAMKEAVKRYCSRIASTNSWGGHPELRALSATIGVPIIVYRANAAPLIFEPDGAEVNLNRGNKDSISDAALRVTFHAHYLTLGEHYNTVISL